MRLLWSLLLLLLSVVDGQIDNNLCPFACECTRQDVTRFVDCSSLDLSIGPAGLNKFQYEVLNLSDNRLISIPEISMTRLERLLLADNQISRLDSRDFESALVLEELDLSRNRILHLQDLQLNRILPLLTNLKILKLNANPLTFGIEKTPMRSKSIEVLEMNNCSLNSFDGSNLKLLPKLRELYLGHNPIKWLKNMTSDSVQILNLKYCDIDLLTNKVFTKMTALKNLTLVGNYQLDIYSLISTSLHDIDASKCRILVPKLLELPEIRRAWFSENKIESISSHAFHQNSNLVTLDLSRNVIRNLNKSAFIGLDNVIEINLSFNYITTINEDLFSKNYGLRKLLISSNLLMSLVNLKSKTLETLDVSFNEINTISSNSLSGMEHLKFLNLSRNYLEKFQEQSSTSLEFLDLSLNRLIFIDNETFAQFPALIFLSLKGNRLTQLVDLSIFPHSEMITFIYLADNPWECHCENQSLKYLYENLRIKMLNDRHSVDIHKIRCNMKSTFTNLCWDKWYPVQRRLTKSESFNIILYMFILVLLMVMAIVGLVRYRLRLRREKDRRRRVEEAREAREMQARLIRQHRESVLENERRRAEERELERQQQAALQQPSPPTYEEAIQLARSKQSLCSVCSTRNLNATVEIEDETPNNNITSDNQHPNITQDTSDSEEEEEEEPTSRNDENNANSDQETSTSACRD